MAQVETEHSVRGQEPLMEVTEHPALRNPLVLNHILGYCSVSDLKSCRLVSSFWRSSALTSWKKSAFVKIETREKRVKFSRFFRFQNPLDAHQLYVNFSLRIRLNCTSFWKPCRGGHVIRLELVDCPSIEEKYFREIIFRDCPNLRHLMLAYLKIMHGRNSTLEADQFEVNRNLKTLTYEQWAGNRGFTWAEFFRKFPAIEVLDIGGLSYEEEVEIVRAILTICEEDPDKLRLKNIRLMGAFKNSPEMMQVVTDPNLPLEHLRLGLPRDKGAAERKQILTLHRSHLKSLELYRWEINSGKCLNPRDVFPFPLTNAACNGTFQNLTYLKLIHCVFTNLEFLKLTPNLRKLSIHNVSKYSPNDNFVFATSMSQMAGVNLPRCVELEVNGRLAADPFRKLVTWIPNVEIVRLEVVDNLVFSLICAEWPKLVSLEIRRCEVDSSGLTGLDSIDLNPISCTQGFCRGGPTVPRANISNLKHLRNLSLSRVDPVELDRFTFGHCAFVFGIQQASSLSNLSLHNYRVFPRADHWQAVIANLNISVKEGAGPPLSLYTI